MSFKVVKNIKIPERTYAQRDFPFDEMQVGDSFEVPAEAVASARQLVSRFARKTGRKFSVRRYMNSHRCWRVS
jgi:hypothetical protein